MDGPQQTPRPIPCQTCGPGLLVRFGRKPELNPHKMRVRVLDGQLAVRHPFKVFLVNLHGRLTLAPIEGPARVALDDTRGRHLGRLGHAAGIVQQGVHQPLLAVVHGHISTGQQGRAEGV